MADQEDADKKDLVARDQAPGRALDIPTSISPEDLVKTIQFTKDKTLERVREPSLLDRLTNAGARERANEIERVKTGEIKAGRVYIDHLIGMIDAYVGANLGGLKLRTEAMIHATSLDLGGQLARAVGDLIVSYLETYSRQIDQINAIRNLSPEERALEIKKARERAVQAREDASSIYRDIFNKMTAHVDSINSEIAKGAPHRP